MKVAILTGGGDCPGMNAFIRGVTRGLPYLVEGAEVWGLEDGWKGLIENRFRLIRRSDVAGILHQGGTILGTLRAPELRDDVDVQKQAARHLEEREIDYLFMQGGNGSLRACAALEKVIEEQGGRTKILATSGSIDNDVANLHGFSIGFHSAMEKSVHMQQWIRDTASSHSRVFVIASMGARSGFLAFYSGIASGAEYVIRPKETVDFDELALMIEKRSRDTRIVVAEAFPMSVEEIKDRLHEALEKNNCRPKRINTVDMGYFQRGGLADTSDVLLASWLSFHMARAAKDGKSGGYYACHYFGQEVAALPIAEAAESSDSCHATISEDIIEMARALR